MAASSIFLLLGLISVTNYLEGKKTGEDHKTIHDQKINDYIHEKNVEHDKKYDHEVFLGTDEAKAFAKLTSNESKERLGFIFDKIDQNNDGEITREELRDWIQYVQKRYIRNSDDVMWKEKNVVNGFLTWRSYKKSMYGFEDDHIDKNSPNFPNKDKINRDERRWIAADKNKDGKLDRTEFADFTHPEEAEHLEDIVAHEIIEDMDKDADGFISLEEYIVDMWPNQDREKPKWVEMEMDKFYSVHDKNHDGKLDHDEVKEWMIPSYDNIDAEAKHLIYESDTNKDGKLTKDEVLEHYDIFVGSQALNFGQALTWHNEL